MNQWLTRWHRSRPPLVLAFVFTQLWYLGNSLLAPTFRLVSADLAIYAKFWMHEGMFQNSLSLHHLYGINTSWVYPALALVPVFIAWIPEQIFLSYLASTGVSNPSDVQVVLPFGITWVLLTVLLNTFIFRFYLRRTRGENGTGYASALWLWFAIIILLHGLYLNRVDGPALALTLFALPLLAERPRVAAALLALGTWIKVWPVALLLALMFDKARRWTAIVVSAAVSAVVAIVAIVLGGNLNLLSFITAQTSRTLQIESIFALPWMLKALPAKVFLDMDIYTWEISGAGIDDVARIVNYVMVGGVLLTIVAALVAKWRGLETQRLLALASMALLLDLILFNKVGSPQYIAWLLVPLILLLLAKDKSGIRVLAWLTVYAALFTGLIAPLFYDDITGQTPW
ncbi:MAG: glycosyltransferase 87 family protein, partial [Micrococcales bacterium]